MAGTGLVGRDVSMTVGGATLQGVVTKDLSIANSELDVTDDQSSGYRELLSKGGLKTLDVSVSGPVKNYELAATMFSTTQMVAVVVDLGDGATTESQITCNCFLSSLDFTNPANEVSEFSASLMSSGAITFTAGS